MMGGSCRSIVRVSKVGSISKGLKIVSMYFRLILTT